MYIYADESGNSGRNIFDATQPIYRQGAIISIAEINPIIEPIFQLELNARKLDRLHARQMRPRDVADIAIRLVKSLNTKTKWSFHVTSIHKPYLATTKFVDTVFDSGENVGARWLWYNVELFRHIICCAIDDLLTQRNRERFWTAFLADDIESIKACIRNAETYRARKVSDRRLSEVIRDAFQYALRYPEEITLLAAKTRKGYQGHTPNLVAFTSLLQHINSFAKQNDCQPVAFYHDEQQEFRTILRETHELFSPIHIEHNGTMMPKIRRVEYDIARFSMPSSKDMLALQAVDILLWLEQRGNGDADPIVSEAVDLLQERIESFYISRSTSELIVRGCLRRIYSEEMPADVLLKGQDLSQDIEKRHLERIRKFELSKRGQDV